MERFISKILIVVIVACTITSCIPNYDFLKKETQEAEYKMHAISSEKESETEQKNPDTDNSHERIFAEKVYVDFTAPYATFSIINDGYATLYTQNPENNGVKNKTVAVNAGHGTKNGSKIKTFSHPDFSPKVSGGTTKEGEILSYAISDGTVLNDGTPEAVANLRVANKLKELLLADGYNVLMIREDDDCRLDNIARTVIANENADCHVSIHFDSTTSDKGIFYITPYNKESYLNMEPVKSNAKNIKKLGNAIIEAFKEMGEKIWKEKGTLQGDLTQISYSTNASVDVELGDKATVLDDKKILTLATGIKNGIDKYFGN